MAQVEQQIQVNEEKKKGGRKSITGLHKKDNKEYFNEYYHLKGAADAICECGALVKHSTLNKHMKRAIHIRRMKQISD